MDVEEEEHEVQARAAYAPEIVIIERSGLDR